MSQIIPAVTVPHVEHGVLINLTIPDAVTGVNVTYYISNCYTNVMHMSNLYRALGSFLEISDVGGDLQNTHNEISVSLSGIPSNDGYFDVLQNVLKQQIKGSNIEIYRVFFDSATQQIKSVSGQQQVFLRFKGYITNYNISEDMQGGDITADVSHSITVTASSILGVLEHRKSGRRTSPQSYQTYYNEPKITTTVTSDPSMNRVAILRNASFDFGKKV